MAEIVNLKDKNDNQILPVTVAKAVYNGNERLDNRLKETPRYKDPLGTAPSTPRDADTLDGKTPEYYAKQSEFSLLNQKITNVDNKFYLADRSIKGGVGILDDDKTYYFDVQDNEHIHRVVFNDTNIFAQKFKNNGEFVKTTFNSVLNPVVVQIEFINGSSTEPSNCTYTITGNQLIVNLAGFIYEGAGNVITNLGAFQYTTCARANVTLSNGAIIYINANDKNLAITGSTGGSVYCQLIIPIING